MAPTNVFFSPAVRSEQMLYEDLVIEGLRMYGQDMLYIPRVSISSDEILNEEYSRFNDAYKIEMYIANTQGFEGEGTLLSKFGLEIRDQATFIVAKRRFEQLVQIDENDIAHLRPREGDLIFLPLTNSMFEIKFVEHENPFYRLSDLPIYELQCEMFEYTSERFDTGISGIDTIENMGASATVLEITGGTSGFAPFTRVYQVIESPDSDGEGGLIIAGEVADFVRDTDNASVGILSLVSIDVDPPSSNIVNFDPDNGPLLFETDDSNTGWSVSRVLDINDSESMGNDPFAGNSTFALEADDIIDFSTVNPFGDPRVGE